MDLQRSETKRGLVVTGGEGPEKGVSLDNRADWTVVAADAGLSRAVRLGIKPDAIVGDMDSLDRPELLHEFNDVEVMRYAPAKDWTDTEIALNYLWKQDIERITILGGGGGRLDHLLGIVALFDREPYPKQWITNRDIITAVDDIIEFGAPEDGIVSFFPIGPDTCRMRSSGLKWSLDELVWKRGDVGISNECLEKTCQVKIVSGRLLMIHALSLPLVL